MEISNRKYGEMYCCNMWTEENYIRWFLRSLCILFVDEGMNSSLSQPIWIKKKKYSRYLIQDGSLVWKVKASDGSISATGCPHLQTNSILFGTLDGSCLALQQSTGKLLWKQKLADPIFVSPVVLDSGLVLFCSVAGVLTCFDLLTNTKVHLMVSLLVSFRTLSIYHLYFSIIYFVYHVIF